MLELKEIVVSGVQNEAVRPLSLLVEKGELVCLTGASDALGTALLQAILGMRKLESGFINLDFDVITQRSAPYLRQQMAYLPADIAGLFPREESVSTLPALQLPDTVSAAVKTLFGLHADAAKPFDRDELLAQWAELNLDATLFDSHCRDLSLDQLQRILLSVAACQQRSYLLLDNPTRHQQEEDAFAVAYFIRKLANQGAAVVCFTRDNALLSQCDKRISI